MQRMFLHKDFVIETDIVLLSTIVKCVYHFYYCEDWHIIRGSLEIMPRMLFHKGFVTEIGVVLKLSLSGSNRLGWRLSFWGLIFY